MGLSISPVIGNMYMEYFEEVVLGPQYPTPTSWWKRYVDDVICIVKKEQGETIFNHLNSVDPNIKFTMEALDSDSCMSFLDNKCSFNSDYTLHSSVFRKPTHTIGSSAIRFLPKTVIQALP